jgi:hypothetical protein
MILVIIEKMPAKSTFPRDSMQSMAFPVRIGTYSDDATVMAAVISENATYP